MKNLIKALITVTFASVTVNFALQSRGDNFPVIPTHSVPSPNGYDYICKASDSANTDLKSMATDYPQFAAEPWPEVSGLSPADKVAVLKAVSTDLQSVRDGLKYPYVNPPIRVMDEHSFEPAQFRVLGQLLSVEGDVEAQQGNWAAASSSYIDAIDLGIHIPKGSWISGLMSGMDCEASGQQGLWTCMQHLTADQAKTDLDRLETIESHRTPIAENFLEDKYQTQAELLNHFQSSTWAFDIADAYWNEGQGPDTIKMTTVLKIIGTQKLFNEVTRYQNALVKSVQTPYAAKIPVERVPIDPMMQVSDLSSHLNPYTTSLRIYARYVDCQAQNQMLIVAFALREYHEQQNSYPQSLTALVPTYLTKVPGDPYSLSGQLQYRQTGSTYRLYSIGPDSINDHGKPIHNVTGSPAWVRMDSKGDVVAGVNP